MKKIGEFKSPRWGDVHVLRATYGKANGPLAIVLHLADGEALASGLFIERDDMPHAESGYVTAPVWQLKAGA